MFFSCKSNVAETDRTNESFEKNERDIGTKESSEQRKSAGEAVNQLWAGPRNIGTKERCAAKQRFAAEGGKKEHPSLSSCMEKGASRWAKIRRLKAQSLPIEVHRRRHLSSRQIFVTLQKVCCLAPLIKNWTRLAHEQRDMILPPSAIRPKVEKLGVGISFLQPSDPRSLATSYSVHGSNPQQLALQICSILPFLHRQNSLFLC